MAGTALPDGELGSKPAGKNPAGGGRAANRRLRQPLTPARAAAGPPG
ncbi:MAG: hypothetical protein U0871_09545 [Gemmataceae bacterium]